MTDTKQFLRFSWSSLGSRIQRKHYCPTQTDERATFEEIDRFLREVEAIYYKVMRPVYLYGIIAMIYTSISMGYLLLSGKEDQQKTNTDWIAEAAWYLSYLVALGIGYFFYEFKKEKVSAHLQILIQMYHSVFGAKELRWVIPGDFPEAIELWKDYLVSNMHTYLDMGSVSTSTSASNTKSSVSESTKLVGKGWP